MLWVSIIPLFILTSEFFRPRFRWRHAVWAGIAGMIGLLVRMSLRQIALISRAMPEDGREASKAAFIAPLFFGSMGMIAFLLTRPHRRWSDLNIAE